MYYETIAKLALISSNTWLSGPAWYYHYLFQRQNRIYKKAYIDYMVELLHDCTLLYCKLCRNVTFKFVL